MLFPSFWFLISGKQVKLTLQDVLLGIVELINHFITLAKLHIWISRKRSVAPNLTAFKEIVEAKFRIEKYTAMKSNTEVKFRARWQLYINSSQEL